MSSYGNPRRDRQRIRGSFSGMIWGVSNTPEGSKILTFLLRPRLVCSSLLLHLAEISCLEGYYRASWARRRPMASTATQSMVG
jgi:hypothetical protein